MIQRWVIICLVSVSSINALSAQVAAHNPFFHGDQQTARVTPVVLTDIGKYHYDEKWNAGNIYLKNGDTLTGYYMRYDLMRNHVEVIIDKLIQSIHGNLVEKFEWFDVERLRETRFISSESFAFDEDKPSGFLEVLEEGDVILLKHRKLIHLKDASSPTLVNDTNSDNTQLFDTYFLARGAKTIKISNRKKENLQFFQSETLEDYLGKTRLRFGKEKDLKKIVKYYNGL